MAKRRMKANFEFINKLGVDWWCFHDRDIAPDGKTLENLRISHKTSHLDEVVALAKELQTAAEYDRWREIFFNELEIVFVDVLHLDANSGVILKIKGMYCTAVLGNSMAEKHLASKKD